VISEHDETIGEARLNIFMRGDAEISLGSKDSRKKFRKAHSVDTLLKANAHLVNLNRLQQREKNLAILLNRTSRRTQSYLLRWSLIIATDDLGFTY